MESSDILVLPWEGTGLKDLTGLYERGVTIGVPVDRRCEE